MLFTDSLFIFYFLPFALIVHRLTNATGRTAEYPYASRLAIFLLTLLFYGLIEPWWLIPFGFCIVADYSIAALLARTERPGRRLLLVWLSVFQNISMLVIFKYWNFILANVARLSPALAEFMPRWTEGGSALPLPPGISFYVFESLSFVIDIYRRKILPPKDPLEFFAFIGMFPRFMAGPIVRYSDMREQLASYRGMRIEQGLFIFVVGLFFKCCFADNFEVFVGCAFTKWEDARFVGAWVGAVAYTMQLYFDFSGYSLMAIGLGRCFGFQFPNNFNKPYLADSVREFWKRWHISLSSWLRDYLYVSLGGSRKGEWRTYLNLFLTMLIGGIWHGAQWAFVLWGAWHGIALVLERALGLENRIPRFIRRIYTLLVVIFGLVIFRSNGPRHAWHLFRAMVSPFDPLGGFNAEIFTSQPLSLAFAILGLIYCFFVENRFDVTRMEVIESLDWRYRGATAVLLGLALVILFSNAGNVPFLYYQF